MAALIAVLCYVGIPLVVLGGMAMAGLLSKRKGESLSESEESEPAVTGRHSLGTQDQHGGWPHNRQGEL